MKINGYWGKARKDGTEYHLLSCHCLDVAAVARQWLLMNPALMQKLVDMSRLGAEHICAWLLYFIALHDYGKAAVPFQLKLPGISKKILGFDSKSKERSSKNYYHGQAGYNLFRSDMPELFEKWSVAENWDSWMRIVASHHGSFVDIDPTLGVSHYHRKDKEEDRLARKEWQFLLEEMFLTPHGLSIHNHIPPKVDPVFLAGLCSIADWLGSNTSHFPYQSEKICLHKYWENTQQNAIRAISESGLISRPKKVAEFSQIFPKFTANTFQQKAAAVAAEPSLIVCEAPTGMGKTEEALFLAAKMIAAGLADSIIFALPTQATANAMQSRIGEYAKKVFPEKINFILAHSKAGSNEVFKAIRSRSKYSSIQSDDAFLQCQDWLSSSRKRVFLGQVAVCTIDQVLLSALPIRHNFVRAFGLGKAVLIVDEVHAFDAHMLGLLKAVIRQQSRTASPTILLSATLASGARRALISAWSSKADTAPVKPENSYPLITQVTADRIQLSEPIRIEDRYHKKVKVTFDYSEDHLMSEELKTRIIAAAKKGAYIGIVCNLVDDAIAIYEGLAKEADLSVKLFHSRFTYQDRQKIETSAIETFGDRNRQKGKGKILVATQVIEQSLDIDFDLMITQICPIDLVFQRMGRLYRFHDKACHRPLVDAECVVLASKNYEFGRSNYIYKSQRFLWRTQKTLESQPLLEFPGCYRRHIESVYEEQPWANEPDDITKQHQEFYIKQLKAEDNAKQLAESGLSFYQEDSAEAIELQAKTRDGEMSLPVLLLRSDRRDGATLLDGSVISQLPENERQDAIENMTVRVPASWQGLLREVGQKATDVLGKQGKGSLWSVLMKPVDGEFVNSCGDSVQLRYSGKKGFFKEI